MDSALGITAAGIIVIATIIYGVSRLTFRNRTKTIEDINSAYSVWIADGVVCNRCPNGEIEHLAINELTKVLVETNDSGPWGYDVWFVLEGAQGHQLAFPLEATGHDKVLAVLKELPGFQMKGMNSVSNATFECWPNPEPTALS